MRGTFNNALRVLMSTKPSSTTNKSNTKQNFKRLMAYAKAYKAAALVSILGMLGYAAIDSLSLF